jgi:glycosyltransferase involved in cell wall biosynthesis
MVPSTVLLAQCELLKLNQFKLELTQENRDVVLQIVKELLAGDGNELLLEHSAFLVETLFKFGIVLLAEQVARRRQEKGLNLTAFDHLAINYRILDQYDFESLEVYSHRPLYQPRPKQSDELRVLSFLYTTPVFQQNGYTVRTGSILANTQLEVFPFGRIGYPWMSKLLRDNQKSHSANADGVEYHHRRGQLTRQSDVFGNIGLAKHEIKKIIAELRPDIVHAASNFTVGLPAMLAARECRLPFVYEMRGIWELTAGVGVFGWEQSERFQIERRLETFIAKRADRIITLTETQKAELSDRGVPASRVDVVPNFFEGTAEPDSNSAFAHELRQKLNGRRVIGYIGSIVNYEGLQDLVEALARKNPSLHDVVLLILGDGPYLGELKTLVSNKGMDDRVIFTGRVPRSDAEAAYTLIDLCILPRLDHPVAQLVSPLKLIEILAKGKVLLVSDVQAMTERVREIGYGELFASGDVDDLEHKVIEMLTNLAGYQQRYDQAPKFVNENHTWKQGALLWDASLREAFDEWQALARNEGIQTPASNAARSLLPPILKTIHEESPQWIRVGRAKLFGPNIEQVVLYTPVAFDRGLTAVLFNVEDHTGTAMGVKALAPSATASRWVISAQGKGERHLYFYVSAEFIDQAGVRSWKLTTAGGKPVPLTFEDNRILAVEVTQNAGRDEFLLVRSEHPQAVQCVMSMIPLNGATTSPVFEKKSFSAAIGAKYQYTSIEPGEKLFPIKTGVTGNVLIELTSWQEGLRGAARVISRLRYSYGQMRPQSYFLELPRDKHNVLVVARLNENLIDGSAIWLKTLVSSLAANPNVNVFVATNAILIPNSINAPMFSRPNVVKLDLQLPTEKRAEALAAEVTLLDRISGGFDTIIVRGTAVAAAMTNRSLRSRTVFYSVGLITPDTVTDGVYNDESGLHLMRGHEALIFQSEHTRDIFLRSTPSFQGRCYVFPPSVDVEDLDAAQASASASEDGRYIVYAGKAIREYGVLELLRAVTQLRKTKANSDIRLVLLGSKFDGNDLTFQGEFHQLVNKLGAGILWIPAASPTEVLGWVKRADVVWGWRHGEFENSHFEVSTKMIEAICCGTPIILYPSAGNTDILGPSYDGFAENEKEAAGRLVKLLRAGKAQFKSQFQKIGARFRSDRTYRPLVEALSPPERGKRILIASHDFRFIEDIESNLLRDGHRVHRQIWRNHTDVLEHGEHEAAADADVIHCEWCLGNAVWWSNNLPEGKKLTIRLHLQEITTDHPSRVNFNRVDRVIFISPHIMREAIEKFSIPPEICEVVPISVALQPRAYTRKEILARRDVLGLIGITPWRKRPDLALELFKRLKTRYGDLKLTIKGNMPTEYAWMKNRSDEVGNYQSFFRDVMRTGGDGDIEILEYDDRIQSFYERAGWILSVSDFEGCHTAVAEGGVLGSLPLMLNWAGAGEVYPPRYVRTDLDGLESAFDEWYTRFPQESETVARLFVKEFGLDAVYRRWAEILGVPATTPSVDDPIQTDDTAKRTSISPSSPRRSPPIAVEQRYTDQEGAILLTFSDAPRN